MSSGKILCWKFVVVGNYLLSNCRLRNYGVRIRRVGNCRFKNLEWKTVVWETVEWETVGTPLRVFNGLILVCQKCKRSKTKKSKGGQLMPLGQLSQGMPRGSRKPKNWH